MGYFQPVVIYRNPDENREHSIIRYIGNRINTQNKNALIALVGTGGMGKSWGCLGIAEIYSKMFNIPFNPDVHVVSSLKELLLLITADDVDKKIKYGSVIVFDEPQIEANAREWQSEINQALAQLVSTFRNQRLFVLFAVPFLSMIDKQTRILFHGEFKVTGFDKDTGMTHIKPRFLEYVQDLDRFYRKRLIIQYKSKTKDKMNIIKLQTWDVPRASKQTIDIYEGKKKRFTDDLNKKLLNRIMQTENQEKRKDLQSDYFKIKELFPKYGWDIEEIMRRVPHLSPTTIEKYISLIKKAQRTQENSEKHLKLLKN